MTAVTIYEPLYKPGQVQIEPLFTPWKVPNPQFVDWREFRIYVDMYLNGLHKGSGKVGMFSPKFQMKAQMPTQRFLDYCIENAAADVCFFNPFPQIRYLAYNVWMQGETWHPGLHDAAQALMDAAGTGIQIAQVPRHDERTLAYSNFWVANEAFWEAFVGGLLLPVARFMEANPAHPAVAHVLKRTYHTDEAPFLPFIMERMFSTFLSLNPQWRSASMPVPDMGPYCLNEAEHQCALKMKPEIDQADKAGDFPPSLIQRMKLVCEANTEQAKHFFLTNPHPHSGRPIVPKA
ncbi:hypothetical protein [Hydrogenophaga sp. 5NK40-0174]|uniref:hypothetical protein n=1 Tax=Hydrogenophaga sp. 5NK40-0174 TaxID=3127649 RepID=UPI003102F6D0